MTILKAGDVFADNYKLVRFIDTGGFAEVWEAVFINEPVALKIFPRLNEEGVEKVKAEYAQSRLLHTHLIVPTYFGVYENRPYLVMRFCGGGNASRKIAEVDEREIAKCMYHVAGALAFLHQNDYVHQDIKPNNILLDDHGNYYLSDLGLSIRLRQTIRRFTQGMKERRDSKSPGAAGVAPTCYRGPELYNNPSVPKPPIQASDVWAFGATLFEIATGEVPFGEWGGMVQLNDPEPPGLPNNFSPGLSGVLKKCLAKEPWERPKAAELEEWAACYLKTGRWPEEEALTPVMNEAGQKTDTVRSRKGWKKPVLILLVVLAIAGAGWAIYQRNQNSSTPVVEHNKPSNTGTGKQPTITPSDTGQTTVVTPAPKDTDGDGVPDNKDKRGSTPTDTPMDDKGSSVKKVESVPKQNHENKESKELPEKANSIVTTFSGAMAPRVGTIRITKVERKQEALDVHFLLEKTPGESNETFSIYGPEDQTHCWYIDAGGAKYRLLSVSKTGTNLKFESAAPVKITATFQKIPDHVKTILIMEGKDQDKIGQTYWNFKVPIN